ncbi:MAG: hypothetical protein SO054_01230, partial [Ruminococcus callidus]|nr:hypothetical protein [Ruminococcus callidus]
GRRLAILGRVCRRHFRWATGWFVSAPTAHWNRWEVIALDSFVTFRDLLEIGTFLISLATFITSLCKNHNNRNHKKTKK